jgi:hypothetical protein
MATRDLHSFHCWNELLTIAGAPATAKWPSYPDDASALAAAGAKSACEKADA